ncbi:MAG: twin-arginine translocase TatA/TatE family subunit [Chloroflexi bacterium]|nr:twin-arginine translocase TatA/TatE family subunit [Chloroflexota bacterium]
MNFFGVGPAELIVILVVALVFVGPDRLPRLAADLARTIREIRKYTGAIAAEFTEVIQDFEKETDGARSQWKDIGEGLTDATKSLTDAIRAARSDAEGGDAPAAAASVNGSPIEPEWREIPEPGTPVPDGPPPEPATPEQAAGEAR